MKCNELKAHKGDVTIPVYGTIADAQVYLKKDVDAAIAELKAKLDKAIAERDGNQVCIDALKQKLENVQASMYADVVDANMENRRLRRALYKACAEWALSTIAWLDCIDQGNPIKWGEMRRKCLEKVEEYK